MDGLIEKGIGRLFELGSVVILLVVFGYIVFRISVYFFKKWEEKTEELIKEKVSHHTSQINSLNENRTRELALKDEQFKTLLEKYELYDEVIKMSKEQLSRSDVAYVNILTDFKKIHEESIRRNEEHNQVVLKKLEQIENSVDDIEEMKKDLNDIKDATKGRTRKT